MGVIQPSNGVQNSCHFPKPNMIYIALQIPPKKKPAPNKKGPSKIKSHVK